jgi:hypothetical protein
MADQGRASFAEDTLIQIDEDNRQISPNAD